MTTNRFWSESNGEISQIIPAISHLSLLIPPLRLNILTSQAKEEKFIHSLSADDPQPGDMPHESEDSHAVPVKCAQREVWVHWDDFAKCFQ